MKKAEVKRLFADDIFQAKLGRVDSMESLQTLLADYGVKMTLDQMETAIKKGSSEELTQEDLNSVSGGGIFNWLKFAWDCFMFAPMEVH